MRVASLRTVTFSFDEESDEGTYDVALTDDEHVQRFEFGAEGSVTAFVIRDAGPAAS